jgi:hypothetical protein
VRGGVNQGSWRDVNFPPAVDLLCLDRRLMQQQPSREPRRFMSNRVLPLKSYPMRWVSAGGDAWRPKFLPDLDGSTTRATLCVHAADPSSMSDNSSPNEISRAAGKSQGRHEQVDGKMAPQPCRKMRELWNEREQQIELLVVLSEVEPKSISLG